MKLRHSLLKSAAVLSSVLLVAGWIGYRAGAFNGLLAPSPPPADPVTSPVIDQNQSVTTTQMFSSSKSITIQFQPEELSFTGDLTGAIVNHPAAPSQQSPPDSTQPALTIMPPSKSFRIFIPELIPHQPE